MGQGYTRNDTSNNIADGNVINASDLDGEFNAVDAAFNESSGHTHDGTADEGAPVTVLGPVQDFVASATEIKPKTTNTLDIGTASLQFKDMYLDGSAYIDGLGEDILVATDKKVQFRDTALFINSSTDGQLDIAADTEVEITTALVEISNDLTLKSDAAVLGFGADTDVTLTHVADTGLLVNAAMVVQFRDSAINIGSPADGDLDINADSEIELNSTLIDINGNVEISGTLSQTGIATFTDDIIIGDGKTIGSASAVDAMTISSGGIVTFKDDILIKDGGTIGVASDADAITIASNGQLTLTQTLIGTALDISGDIDVDGTTNLDVVDIDGAVDMASTLQVDGAITSSAGATITTADNTTQLTLISTDADASEGPRLDLRRNSSSPADDDVLGTIRYKGENDASEDIVYAEIEAQAKDVSDGTEDSELRFFVRRAGDLREGMMLGPDSVVFNEAGADVDVRFETTGKSSAFSLDAGNDTAAMTVPLTITSDDNNSQLTLTSTDADASGGPSLLMFRDSSSPADGDAIGQIQFKAEDSGGTALSYARIRTVINDVTDGTEDGEMVLETIVGGTIRSRVELFPTETVINEDSQDLDFRIEGDSSTHAFFVQGSDDFIGINESSPQNQLHITTSDFKALQLEGPRPTAFFKETGASANENFQIRLDGGDLQFQQQNDAQSSASTKMQINQDGTVLVGSAQISTSTLFTVDNGSSGRAADIYRASSSSTNHICNFVSDVGGSQTIQQVMEASGDIESRTSSLTGTSDRTLKENITDATNQWDDIKALEFKNFNFIGDPDRPMLGVIAQDVEAAGMTGLVKTSEETGKMSVKYTVMYMKAVIALQEAMARIETLETQRADLETRLAALEA
mgnify:CR=1 FL=1|tara:strand:- start:8621 stop:11215 length:2595 start_codon:yes stop_codon:yes gene_type:complete